jgi:MEDS: MEthanogen/methylotroph, DcmR Sensory domain
MKHAGFQHHALIYEGSDDYLAGTIPFLRDALEAGEPSMVAVGHSQRELIEAELGDAAGRVCFADMESLGRNPAWIIPFWREFVDEAEGRPVRGIGEAVWAARSPAALDECERHEALLNVAFAPGQSWSLLCPYDACSLGDDVLGKVCRSHPHVRREGRVEASGAFQPHRDCFAGELPPPAAAPESLVFGLTGLAEVRHRVAVAAEASDMDALAVADLVTPPASSPPTASCTVAAPAPCGSGARRAGCWSRSRTAAGSKIRWSVGCAPTPPRREAAVSGSPTASATWSRSAPASAGRSCACTCSPPRSPSSNWTKQGGVPGP